MKIVDAVDILWSLNNTSAVGGLLDSDGIETSALSQQEQEFAFTYGHLT
jgi:hypothetical protein